MGNPLPFAYQIRRSARATQVRIVVRPSGKVEVVAPPKGMSDQCIAGFVQEKSQWVMQALAKMARVAPTHSNPVPYQYKDGMDILYQGRLHRISVRATTNKHLKFDFTDHFILHLPHNLAIDQQGESIRAALIHWFKKQTLVQVQAAISRHADRKKLYPRSIVIKTQKSRWGSCGYQGDININWLLILAPPAVLEYVVVHELCHILVRNHSRQFWDLVTEHLPDYQSRRRWLKTQGRSLMAFHD